MVKGYHLMNAKYYLNRTHCGLSACDASMYENPYLVVAECAGRRAEYITQLAICNCGSTFATLVKLLKAQE